MRISPVSFSNYNFAFNAADNKKKNQVSAAYGVTTKGVNGDRFVMAGNANEHFHLIKNVSNEKIGSKFILQPKDPKYKDLKILITPDSEIKSDSMYIGILKKGKRTPSFNGRLYGSIREDGRNIDYNMQNEYIRYFMDGMHAYIENNYKDTDAAPQLVDDYNFFIPSDGDGTRYKDITTLQGGVTKPASYIPAQINGQNMSLVQNVISNFSRTGKLDKMFDIVKVKPAQGSAYAFLEALKRGQLSANKPVVFSWGDNFSDINVSKLMLEHENSGSAFTITAIPTKKEAVKSLGLLKIDSIENKTIQEITEKPTDDDYIETCLVPELGDDMCLASVGPYVLSPEVLSWIKDNYIEDPESFLNPTKGYDFSSMIISPVLEALNNGEITDKNGNPSEMKLYIVPEDETWSDLGSQKDFSYGMKQIKYGQYSNLPLDVRKSIKENIDDEGNITFNKTSRSMFDSLCKELNVNMKNVIAYYPE